MRRSFAAIAFFLMLSVAAAHADSVSAGWAQGPGLVFPKGVLRAMAPADAPPAPGMPSPDEMYSKVMSLVGEPQLKWPDERITLDVKEVGIRRVAEILGEQSGISFSVKESVPANLKITIQVGGTGVKQFLDTLCAATNLTYMAESRAEAASAKPPSDEEQPRSVTVTAPQIHLNQTGEGYELVAPSGTRIVTFNAGIGKPVTHVTISSLAAEGVVVNMGTVSLSMKDADPIEAATKLIKQIDGASYMILDLKDYMALQDADRAAEIEKAVQSCPRAKITLTLRNVAIHEALSRLADGGHFYITTPQPGQSNFLIIPDVKVTDANTMPGLSLRMIPLLGDMSNSMRYFFNTAPKDAR